MLYSCTNIKTFIAPSRLYVATYAGASENIRQKIILCVYKNNASAFIRRLKEQYPSMQEWTKRAYLIACSILVLDERKYFLSTPQPF